MEKLLKLLNEYVGEEYLYAEFELGDGTQDNFFHNKTGEHTIEESYVISKKLGFIKWLCNEDKIDENKIEIHWFSFYQSVLMQLSISDNPIQDLLDLLV